MTEKWVKVGEIGVDVGMVWIGDPCYILHKDGEQKPKAIGKNWLDFCNILNKLRSEKSCTEGYQFNYDMGHAGLGVVVHSGWGDGTYDVMARIKDGRCAEIRVVFIEDEEHR